MDKMIFTIMNGMKVVEQRQANTFNELANVNTVGFKKSFNSVVQSRELVGADSLASRAFPSLTSMNAVDMRPGAIKHTGNPLDLYISGEGLFAVQGKDGAEAYTRRGDIKVSDNGLLTTGKGDLLLGDGGPITIPPASKIEIAGDGTVSILVAGEAGNEMTPVGRVKLVNAQGQSMQIRSDGLYQTVTGEELPPDAAISVTPGALEGSAATPIDAMVQMIRDSREYEMQVRVIKNAKEISTASAAVMRMDG